MMGGWSVPGILAFAACSVGAGYGAWRFFIAYHITGCRISFAMAALSAMAPVAALTLAGATGEGAGVRAGLPAVGAVALTGFGLSRSRWLTPMTVGLWLPSAVAHWRAGDGGPLTELLERALGEDGAAHASRTAALVEAITEPLGIPATETDETILAALLHGLGGGLAGGERRTPGTMDCDSSAHMVGRVRGCRAAAAIIEAIPERWDGAGPRGLKAEETPLGARAVAAAEAFDRASSGGLARARATVRGESGTVFDPVVVDELMHLTRALASA
jgi:hypothetical protein